MNKSMVDIAKQIAYWRIGAAEEQIDLLAEINGLNIEGRYPQHPVPPPSIGEAAEYMARIDKVLQCLNLQF